jgi:uncharacterized LabA/DUF88 family protein
LKTFLYVDAFNLYFGAVRGTPYKWLDLFKLAKILLPRNDVVSIKYYTAIVNARPHDPDQPFRQRAYLRALKTIPNLEIFYGHFLTHVVKMPLANPTPGLPALVEVVKTEEKGSDVNLASHLLLDAYRNRFECAVVLTGDSDLLTPVQIVMEEFRKPVGVINPQKIPCRVLERQATFYKHIRISTLKKAQFPSPLKDEKGFVLKPGEW